MESKSKRYQPLFEMATIDKVDKLTVIVYTDHMPKHFHVLKKDAFEITINLNTLKIIDYKWQKNNIKISSNEKALLKKWYSENNKKESTLTNLRAIRFAWNLLNPNKR